MGERSLTPEQRQRYARHLALAEVGRALQHLPGDQREVFELHYYQGLTQAAVARLLETPPRQASRLYVAATATLAARMQQAGFLG